MLSRWETPEERLFSRIFKTETCWLWLGPVWKGYGKFMVDKKNTYVHRYSWQFHNGPIQEGLDVLHKCDVRNCVNPDHLYLGTDLENSQDRVNRGRTNKGKKRTDTVANKGKTRTDPCPQGHEFNEENFKIRYKPHANGGVGATTRECKICIRQRRKNNNKN